jgi:hypothetical protein
MRVLGNGLFILFREEPDLGDRPTTDKERGDEEKMASANRKHPHTGNEIGWLHQEKVPL